MRVFLPLLSFSSFSSTWAGFCFSGNGGGEQEVEKLEATPLFSPSLPPFPYRFLGMDGYLPLIIFAENSLLRSFLGNQDKAPFSGFLCFPDALLRVHGEHLCAHAKFGEVKYSFFSSGEIEGKKVLL